jgi:glycosyltransferase involved in cell wall biosynthesis
MNILYIAPLPPPVTGHSLVSEALKQELTKHYNLKIVDLSKDSLKEGINSFKRILEVLNIIKVIWQRKKTADIIYFTISESFAGNIKDLLIYLVCFNKLQRTFIHLHGGSIKRLLWDNKPLLKNVNYFFIKRLGGVIVTGKSHVSIFENAIDETKIHIIPNFAPEFLYVEPINIQSKFKLVRPLRILYLSNLIPQKGYLDLLEAFMQMEENLQKRVQIDFAGAFTSQEDEKWFKEKISSFSQIRYHGKVDNLPKKCLFNEAHVFCLPTSYFEGQPVSILEAYASGCVVLTTGQDGIRDIFKNKVNGFEIEPAAPESIAAAIRSLLNTDSKLLCNISLANLEEARGKYRLPIYSSRIREVLTQKY